MYNNILCHVIGITRQWGEHYLIIDAGIISFRFLKTSKKKCVLLFNRNI